jgi:cytoskeleton protein RodZ
MPTDSSLEKLPADSEGLSDGLRSPGSILHKERIRRELSEKEVADHLHITMHYVRSIETDKYDKLPGAVFAKGYIKRYAELLELDDSDLLAAYAAFEAGRKKEQDEVVRQQVRHRKDRNKPWVILSIVVFVGGFAALWALYHSSAQDPEINESVASPQLRGDPAGQRLAEPVSSTVPGLRDSIDTDSTTLPSPQAATPPEASTAMLQAEDGADSSSNSAGRSAGSEGAILESVALQQTAPLRQASNGEFDATRAETSAASTRLAASSPDLSEPAVLPAVAEPAQLAQSGSQQPLAEQAVAEISVATNTDGSYLIEVSTAGNDTLRISFSGESWVEVNDSDTNQIYRDLREAGDVLQITGHAPFNILLGDAPYTSLIFNGADVDVSGKIRIDNSARFTVGL